MSSHRRRLPYLDTIHDQAFYIILARKQLAKKAKRGAVLCSRATHLHLPRLGRSSNSKQLGQDWPGLLTLLAGIFLYLRRVLQSCCPLLPTVLPATIVSRLLPVRTAQFDTILNEPPVIITQMKVNTCWP